MNSTSMKTRTRAFALRIIRLVAVLPNTPAGRVIATQLCKAGTSVGANYRSACRARSKTEFIARMGVVEEEADESGYWLELLADSNMVDPKLISGLLDEANAITAIVAASRKTAKATGISNGSKSKIGNRQS